MNLWTKGALTVVGAGPPEIQQPYSWGSHASKLTKVLTGTNPHNDVKLTPDELERIITWVDLNATYYPSYASAYPQNPYGRSPISEAQLARLKQLGVDTGIIDLSFDRPELSPGLAKLPAERSALRRGAGHHPRRPGIAEEESQSRRRWLRRLRCRPTARAQVRGARRDRAPQPPSHPRRPEGLRHYVPHRHPLRPSPLTIIAPSLRLSAIAYCLFVALHQMSLQTCHLTRLPRTLTGPPPDPLWTDTGPPSA